MFKKTLAAALFAAALSASTALAVTNVTVLHVADALDPYWQTIVDKYNSSQPDVVVKMEYLENEAYKAKLPTLLQSDDRPDIIYSWGGGVLAAHAEAGFLEDISAHKDDLLKIIYPSGVGAFEVDGTLYGAAFDFSLVSLYANKTLLDKAGVSADDLSTWAGFTTAMDKLKAAGVTPLVMSGADKWPMQFYLGYLMMREGGGDMVAQMQATGFNNPAFLAASQKLIDLGKQEPFQQGWLSQTFLPSTGQFGDGDAAMFLMGNWLLTQQGPNAKDGKGIDNANILSLPFPKIMGGKGDGTETVGGIDGFEITKGAAPEAIEFLKYFLKAEQQNDAAAQGLYIPSAIGSEKHIVDPLVVKAAETIGTSSKHQLFLDQDLGPDVGRVFNDVAVALAAGEMTPEEGAEALQDAYDNR